MLKKAFVFLLPLSLTLFGCGSNNSSPAQNNPAASASTSDSSEIAQLNLLPPTSSDFSIHFDQVEFADLLSFSLLPPVSPTLIVVDPIPLQRVRIGGKGIITWPVISAQPYVFDGLWLTVAYDPSIANGQTCLITARGALQNNDQLDIKGAGIVFPFDFGWEAMSSPVSGGSPQAAIGQLNSMASTITTTPSARAAFISLIVAAYLNTIDSCTAGAASPL